MLSWVEAQYQCFKTGSCTLSAFFHLATESGNLLVKEVFKSGEKCDASKWRRTTAWYYLYSFKSTALGAGANLLSPPRVFRPLFALT